MDSVSDVDVSLDEETVAIGDASAPATEYTTAGGHLGRYVVIEELGRGGMGRVLRAYDPKLQREVALKVLSTKSMSTEGRARLVTEARAMARLSHPNVVAVFDVEEQDDGGLVLAMEYVPGTTLRAWLRGEKRPGPEIIDRFLEAGKALAAAHDEGLLHRDFKPANVLVSQSGQVKVTDFGLAKSLDAPGGLTQTHASEDGSVDDDDRTCDGLTRAGTVMGTPRYMAPEQHEGAPLGPAADQYAFCVSLWEALTGQAPFVGKDLGALKAAGPPSWPGGKEAPSSVVDALRRGLDPQPLQRWPSMADLLGELDQDRSRSGSRGARAMAGVGLLSALGVSAFAFASTDEGPCQGAKAQLDGIWDDAVRAQTQQSIESTNVSFAPDVWNFVSPRLDDYAGRWVLMHTEACEATAVRHEQSPEVMDRRMACLQRARSQLRATTSTLATADAKTVRNAHDLVGTLPRLSVCEDIQGLLEGVEPAPVSEQEAVDRAQERIADAHVALRAGRLDDADRALGLAASELESLSYEPPRTELLRLQGALLSERGDFNGAQDKYREALTNAVRHRQWRDVLDLSDSLMFVVATRIGKPDEAMRYLEYGEGLLTVVGDPIEEAEHRKMVSGALHYKGDFAAAEKEARASVELLEGLLDEDDLRLADARMNLGVVLDESGHAPEAEEQHRAAMAVHLAALGPKHPDIGEARTNLGNALSAQLRLDEAEAEHRGALEIFENAFGPVHPAVAYSHNNLGATLYKRKDFAGAETEFRKALEVWMETLGPDHPDLSLAHNNIAECLVKQDQIEQAEEPLRRSLTLVEKNLGADHPDAATIRGNLANLLAQMNRGKEAVELAEVSWQAIQRDNIPAEQRATVAYYYGTALWAEGSDRAKARSMVEHALELCSKMDDGVQESFRAEFDQWLADHR